MSVEGNLDEVSIIIDLGFNQFQILLTSKRHFSTLMTTLKTTNKIQLHYIRLNCLIEELNHTASFQCEFYASWSTSKAPLLEEQSSYESTVQLKQYSQIKHDNSGLKSLPLSIQLSLSVRAVYNAQKGIYLTAVTGRSEQNERDFYQSNGNQSSNTNNTDEQNGFSSNQAQINRNFVNQSLQHKQFSQVSVPSTYSYLNIYLKTKSRPNKLMFVGNLEIDLNQIHISQRQAILKDELPQTKITQQLQYCALRSAGVRVVIKGSIDSIEEWDNYQNGKASIDNETKLDDDQFLNQPSKLTSQINKQLGSIGIVGEQKAKILNQSQLNLPQASLKQQNKKVYQVQQVKQPLENNNKPNPDAQKQLAQPAVGRTNNIILPFYGDNEQLLSEAQNRITEKPLQLQDSIINQSVQFKQLYQNNANGFQQQNTNKPKQNREEEVEAQQNNDGSPLLARQLSYDGNHTPSEKHNSVPQAPFQHRQTYFTRLLSLQLQKLQLKLLRDVQWPIRDPAVVLELLAPFKTCLRHIQGEEASRDQELEGSQDIESSGQVMQNDEDYSYEESEQG